MTWFRLMFADRRSRQRGSILSSVLIIVAFLAILVGAVMTELTSSFLVSRTLVNRMQTEATVNSAVELGIHQLQTSTVPAVCAQDGRGPWYVTLNNNPAAVTKSCQAIVPDVATGLAAGGFLVDGIHDTTAGRNRYLVTDSTGMLRAYNFGSIGASWSLDIGGAPTAAPLPKTNADGSTVLLIPSAMAGSGCGGHCVSLFTDAWPRPSLMCSMPASTIVASAPAVEVLGGGGDPDQPQNFPDTAFFAGSGAGGMLYAYDADSGSSCTQLAASALGGGAAGPPLVFPGTSSSPRRGTTTSSDEIFVLVTDGNASSLQHWRFTETKDDDGNVSDTFSRVSSLTLTNSVGSTAIGYAASGSSPNLTLAIVGSTGRVATVNITTSSGPSYTVSAVQATTSLPGPVSRAPYWCHCPGRDLIGVSSTNGVLYLLDSGLTTRWTYDGQVDGRPAINTTPTADANGDWYFGADDGYVYDVEIPTSGIQLFKAARFGPGGAIRTSPLVGGSTEGCSGPCLYFASSTSGLYYARLGSVRIIDLRACISSASGSTVCAANPRLWARVEVGPPVIVGGSGVYVQGWSYYSP
jgi:hypothetical protein